MVKTSPSNAGGVGLIPGRGVKIPHHLLPKKTKFRSNIEASSIKTLRMVCIKNKQAKKKKIEITCRYVLMMGNLAMYVNTLNYACLHKFILKNVKAIFVKELCVCVLSHV